MVLPLLQRWLSVTAICITGLVPYVPSLAQGPTSEQLWDDLILIENAPDQTLSKDQRLKETLLLKKKAEDDHLTGDSVYARILHRIGVYQYYTTHELNKSIGNTLQSLAINTSGKKGACPRFAVNSYVNMGYYYMSLLFYDEALRYFDSAVMLSRRFPGQEKFLLDARQMRSNILYKKGDLQDCVEEATRGLQTALALHDTLFIIKFLNQRAYAYARQKFYQSAASDIATASSLATLKNYYDGIGVNLSAHALLLESMGKYSQALQLYDEAIKYGTLSGFLPGLSEHYLDAGILLLYKMSRYEEGKSYLQKAALTAAKANDPIGEAKAYNSIGSIYFYQKNYTRALTYYSLALIRIGIPAAADELHSPGSVDLYRFQDKGMLLSAFGNKTECLLYLYQRTNRPDYLTACLRTALLTDSLVTTMRHEQIGEQSKLYWRNLTREFFSNAMKACWLAKDPALAFYFMEKSRAVLLNDKLNELGASAFLPPAEAAKQRSLQINVIEQQQALSSISSDSPGYLAQQSLLLQAKDEQERYIRVLEHMAPAYYQYKYADRVPTIDSIQRVLSHTRQTFIDYFVGDTDIYILNISASDAHLLQLPPGNLRDSLSAFLRLCSDRQHLNSSYNTFAALSHSLYQRLFEPLHPSTKRIVICPDNFLIPFEALCSDSAGKHFLVYDHAFDYVYSARYWLKTFPDIPSDGNFLGFAPAAFAADLHVPDLQTSITSIQQAASCYPGYTCLTGKDASRRHFLEQLPHYTVVNVYSHAKADSTDNEPLLFLSDSIIRLSELQLLQRPSAQLVVLSACQTNVGKNAAGEGIYSLARGLASAGIPSVASTLWQADEGATYEITARFHSYLSKGMRKDEALQKAKLDFLKKDNAENLLPYYWANMTLIGNAGPVHLKPAGYPWWPAAIAGLLLAAGIIVYLKKKS